MSLIRWATLAALVTGVVVATPGSSSAKDPKPEKPKTDGVAPEIDPAGAAAIVTLLVGGTVLLTTRRRRSA